MNDDIMYGHTTSPLNTVKEKINYAKKNISLPIYPCLICGCAHLPQKPQSIDKYTQIKCKPPPRKKREEMMILQIQMTSSTPKTATRVYSTTQT